MKARVIFIIWFAWLWPFTASQAHTASASFVSIEQHDASSLNVSMDVAVRDLDVLLGLDANADGNLTWGELSAAQTPITAAVLARIQVQQGAGTCTPQHIDPLQLAAHGDGPYVRVSFVAACLPGKLPLTLDNHAWHAFDPQHRTLVEYHNKGTTQQALLTASSPTWARSESRLTRIMTFFKQGVVHLLTGYDHLAFLSVLLIALLRSPVVDASVDLRQVAWRALNVISAFTLAHSLTLGLAATGHLKLPSKPVEVIIAASVCITALLNLSRRSAQHGWQLAFGFGLVHGLGFASALSELLTTRIDLWSLAAFNVGIEAAQISVAAVLVPVLWLLTQRRWFARAGLPVLSLCIALLAGQWLWLRAVA